MPAVASCRPTRFHHRLQRAPAQVARAAARRLAPAQPTRNRARRLRPGRRLFHSAVEAGTMTDSQIEFDPATGEIIDKASIQSVLSEVNSLAELSKYRDKLQTFGDYGKLRGQQLRKLNDLAEVKIEVEVEIGRRLSAIERQSGGLAGKGRGRESSSHDVTSFQSALSEGAWNRMMAQRWQIMAGWTTLAERREYYARQNEGDADITSADVYRMARTNKSDAEKDDLRSQPIVAVEGIYETIVIDPPWPMEKIEREVRPNQVGFDYPAMDEDELAAFQLPAADDCHLWCWTTQKFLPMALRLIEVWDFRYVCTFVWHKPGGFQPIGLPQYNCEFAVYARIGSPKFLDTKAFATCMKWPRREHSRKPDQFYDLVRRVTAGPRIDIFSREQRDGFAQFGNETDRFEAAE